MQWWRGFALVFLVIACLCSCNRQNPQLPHNTPDVDSTTINLEIYNQLCIAEEKAEIEAYIDSIETADSVRFELTDYGCYIYRHPERSKGVRHPERSEGSHNVSTKAIKDGDAITVACSKELLNGTICSQATEEEPLTLTVGERDVIKGLDLAFVGKSVGDEFDVIIPYNLAYGVTGDRNCIPGMTPVLYRVKIIKI